MTTEHEANADRPSQRLVTTAHLSAVLATLLALEVVGLAIYGYQRMQTAMEPANLGDRVENIIRDNYPQMRAELVNAVKEQSPEIAAEVSHQLVATVPQGREELERFTARQIEKGLEQTTSYSAEQFRKLLDEHHAQVEEMFVKLEKAPQKAEELRPRHGGRHRTGFRDRCAAPSQDDSALAPATERQARALGRR